MSDDRPTEATHRRPRRSTPPKGLVERVKDILLTPKTGMGRDRQRGVDVQSIYTTYVVILAAIGPIASSSASR